jgi:hypothetical protein
LIPRICALLTLSAFLCGGSWFLLRSTPAREAARLEKQIQSLLLPGSEGDWEAASTPLELAELKASKKSLEDTQVRLELARKAADRLLKLSPTSEANLRLRAQIEELAGDFPAALRIYERFLALRIEPPWVLIQRARLHRRLGQFSRARAQLAAAADQFPFLANLEMGELELELLQPDRALTHLRKALAANLEERGDRRAEIEVEEKIAEALNLLITITEGGSRKGALARGADPAARISRLREERDQALDTAIALLKGLPAETKQEFQRQELLLARLYEEYRDPQKVLRAIEDLGHAVSDDEEHRYPQLYLKLGELSLAAAEGLDTREAARWVEEAEGQFLKALGFKDPSLVVSVEPENGGAAFALERRPDKKELLGDLALSIAEKLGPTRESWRILEPRREGRADPLDLHARLLALERVGAGPASRAKLLQAVALLRAGRENESEPLLREVIAAAPGESRAILEERVGDLCFRAAPESLFFLRLFKAREEPAPTLERAAVAAWFELLTRAIGWRRSRVPARSAAEPGGPAEELETEVRALEKARQSLIDGALAEAEGVEDHLWLSGVVGTVRGRIEAIQLLRSGLEKLKERAQDSRELHPLRSRLAGLLFEKAAEEEVLENRRKERESERGSWLTYRECLGQYLPLFKDSPYRRDLLLRVTALLLKWKTASEAPALNLAELVQPLFPEASPGEIEAMSSILELLCLGKFGEAAERAEDEKKAPGLRPYSSWIVGTVLLQEWRRLQDEGSEDGPAAGEGSVARKREARGLLVEELGRSPRFLPLRIELARIRLSDLKPGEDVPEDLFRELRDLAARAEKDPSAAYPLHTLQALAFQLRFEARARENRRQSAALHGLLAQRRTALRRAIQAGFDQPEPYLALAQTYLGGAAMSGMPGARSAELRSLALVEPDYQKAVGVLRFAPETPQVLSALAGLYQYQLKEPREALRYHREVVRRDPSGSALKALIGCFAATADPLANANPRGICPEAFEKARGFIQEFEEKSLPDLLPAIAEELNFPALKPTLLALVAQHQMKSATAVDADLLRQEAVNHYRTAREAYRSLGKSPPVEVLNNLAWLLAESPGGLAEAEETIQEARSSLGPDRTSLYAGTVEDTYGWILFLRGQLEKAEAVYQTLVGEFPSPIFSYHYAKVLLGLKKYRQASAQIETALHTSHRYDEERDAKRLEGEIQRKLQEKLSRDTR